MKYVAEWFDQYELRNKVSIDDGMKRVVLITLNRDEWYETVDEYM